VTPWWASVKRGVRRTQFAR